MSKNHEKEVLKAYENYLAYFLDNDMEGINSLVKFPITYIADGESKSLDAFQSNQKKRWRANNGILQLTQILIHMV